MTNLKNVMIYLIENYPHKDDLSKARLTKMIYLADWRAAVTLGRQITQIEWRFDHYGPYVPDVVILARSDKDFIVDQTVNFFGTAKHIIRLRQGVEIPALPQYVRSTLGFVISTTADKTWDEFIQLVYSTYPIVSQPRFSELKLVELARKYKKVF